MARASSGMEFGIAMPSWLRSSFIWTTPLPAISWRASEARWSTWSLPPKAATPSISDCIEPFIGSRPEDFSRMKLSCIAWRENGRVLGLLAELRDDLDGLFHGVCCRGQGPHQGGHPFELGVDVDDLAGPARGHGLEIVDGVAGDGQGYGEVANDRHQPFALMRHAGDRGDPLADAVAEMLDALAGMKQAGRERAILKFKFYPDRSHRRPTVPMVFSLMRPARSRLTFSERLTSSK